MTGNQNITNNNPAYNMYQQGNLSESINNETDFNVDDDFILTGLNNVNVAQYLTTLKNDKLLSKRDKQLKKLFLLYLRKYQKNPEKFKRHPKQIKNLPTWFYDALDLFKQNEMSRDLKNQIKTYFESLIAYRDSIIGINQDQIVSQDQQFGTASPYAETPYDETYEFSNEDSIEKMNINKYASNLNNQLPKNTGQDIDPLTFEDEGVNKNITPQKFSMVSPVAPSPFDINRPSPPQPVNDDNGMSIADLSDVIFSNKKSNNKSISIGNYGDSVNNLSNMIVARKTTARKHKTNKTVYNKIDRKTTLPLDDIKNTIHKNKYTLPKNTKSNSWFDISIPKTNINLNTGGKLNKQRGIGINLSNIIGKPLKHNTIDLTSIIKNNTKPTSIPNIGNSNELKMLRKSLSTDLTISSLSGKKMNIIPGSMSAPEIKPVDYDFSLIDRFRGKKIKPKTIFPEDEYDIYYKKRR